MSTVSTPHETQEVRTAVVTGAAQGIGAATAELLHARGHNVVLVDIQTAANQQTAARIDPSGQRATAMTVDLRDVASLNRALETVAEQFGGVDILVNNAALIKVTPFWDVQPDEWDDVMAVNVRGYFLASRLAAIQMRERGWGRIVNLTSIAGQHHRSLTGVHYAVSKGAIIALTRVLAREFAPFGITVNAVAESAIETPAAAKYSDEFLREVTAQIPVGRLGQAAEVASAVAFLTAEESAYITGATLDVNGGALMR